MRYDGQIIVNPDLNGMPRQAALTPTAAKAAVAAGVKTAAIVNYEKYVNRPATPAPAKKDVKAKTKPAAKAATKTTAHHPPAKSLPVHSPVHQAALKTVLKPAPVVSANNAVASHPAPPVAAATGQKKPSAGIPKGTPQN